VRGRRTGWARLAAAGAAFALALIGAAAAQADDPASLRGEAEQLRAANAGLSTQSQQALLDLYSLETRLNGAERRLAALEARAAAVGRLEATARERMNVARNNAAEAQRRLATRLQVLYVEGEVDPLAVVLGAESLDDALAALDGLGRVATDDRVILAQVTQARARFRRAFKELSARRAQLDDLVGDARATRDALSAARDERAAYLAHLGGRQAFNRRLIDRLLAQAAAAQEKTQEIAPVVASAPVEAPTSGARMTVSSTGYCLAGSTATGMETGWGMIAVDPSVIPLGTKIFVPGYGHGVAADTGPAVTGRMIDLWFPSCVQALQWGRRLVTITLE
jgi:3D (Asp-Asp-Asp) domain-containing protein